MLGVQSWEEGGLGQVHSLCPVTVTKLREREQHLVLCLSCRPVIQIVQETPGGVHLPKFTLALSHTILVNPHLFVGLFAHLHDPIQDTPTECHMLCAL